MQGLDGTDFEGRVVLPTHLLEAMQQIGAALRTAEWPQMIGCNHSLAELLQIRARDDAAELRLTHQKALERRGAADLDVGKHAQFFERTFRKVLRLVDDEKGASALA